MLDLLEKTMKTAASATLVGVFVYVRKYETTVPGNALGEVAKYGFMHGHGCSLFPVILSQDEPAMRLLHERRSNENTPAN